YHPSEGKVFNLNGTAAFIWSVCDGDRTLDEMVEIIHEEAPDQSRSVIENDVLDFAEDLLEEGLIENSGD
ncbi:MAG: PqqD family protein, partial [bacterium]